MKHGTKRAYLGDKEAGIKPCRCDVCRDAHAANIAEYRARSQARTALAARYAAPWTASEDSLLLQGPGTLLERAQRLDRTFQACNSRLRRLREETSTTT